MIFSFLLDHFIRSNIIIRGPVIHPRWQTSLCCGCSLIKASLLRCEHSALISCSHAGYRGRGSGVVSSVSPSQPFNFNVSMQHSPLILTQSRWEEWSALLTSILADIVITSRRVGIFSESLSASWRQGRAENEVIISIHQWEINLSGPWGLISSFHCYCYWPCCK